MADTEIRDLAIVADDMGSLELRDDHVMAYGTEIGAFLRLDDLSPGFAFGQIDRAIIMSAGRMNARIVLPGHRLRECRARRAPGRGAVRQQLRGSRRRPSRPGTVRQRAADALKVFRDGTSMSKGTTTSTGLVHTYFANIFGPPQYRKLHEELAGRFFSAFYEQGVFVGQLRTRLGIPGKETSRTARRPPTSSCS